MLKGSFWISKENVKKFISKWTDLLIIFLTQAFLAVSALVAAAAADQSSHQVIHGHGTAVSHGVHKAHGAHHALVHDARAAPVHPVHHAVHPVHHAVHPVHHAVHPVVHHAPVVHAAPLVHHAPVAVKVAPVVPVVAHPAPAPYHAPAPAYKPAPYKEPAYDEPAAYAYEYAVADDYSKANFAQNEKRDGYATSGSYRVALPDGRTQVVTYSVADAYGGYVADVSYEGVAQYPEAKPYHPAPAPAYKPAHA